MRNYQGTRIHMYASVSGYQGTYMRNYQGTRIHMYASVSGYQGTYMRNYQGTRIHICGSIRGPGYIFLLVSSRGGGLDKRKILRKNWKISGAKRKEKVQLLFKGPL